MISPESRSKKQSSIMRTYRLRQGDLRINTRLTPISRERLQRLIDDAAREGAQAVADAYGMSHRTLRDWCYRLGVPMPGVGGLTRKHADTMLHRGCSCRDCCARIDDPTEALRVWTSERVTPGDRTDALPAYRDDVRRDGKRRYHANR